MSADRLLHRGFGDGRCGHRLRLLAAPAQTLHLFGGFAARLGDAIGGLQRLQCGDRGTDGIDRIVRAERFRDHVLDPGQLDDGAHGAARANAGTWRRRLEQHLGGSLLQANLVGDGSADYRHGDEVLLRRLNRLANGLGYLAGLPEPRADAAVLVADDHERAEGEATAALDDLRHPVQVDDLLREFRLASSVLVTHTLLLELQSGGARGLGERFDPTVIRKTAAIEDDRLDARLPGALGDGLAHGSRAFRPRGRLQALMKIGVGRGGGGQRPSRRVIDQLGVDVVQAAEDGEPRARGTAHEVGPQPNMPADARGATIALPVHYFAAPAPVVLPVLPALRRIR